MTFKRAKRDLRTLAKGKYCTIRYALTTYKDGREEAKCAVYIDGYSWSIRPTWAEALEAMKNALHPKPQTANESEAPTHG